MVTRASRCYQPPEKIGVITASYSRPSTSGMGATIKEHYISELHCAECIILALLLTGANTFKGYLLFCLLFLQRMSHTAHAHACPAHAMGLLGTAALAGRSESFDQPWKPLAAIVARL